VHPRATPARLFTVVVIAAVSIAGSLALEAQNVCSVAKTNTSCELTIDRTNPVAPPTIQMYSDQTLTVEIINPQPFERYFLDFSSGVATAAPDEASAITTALTANLGKLTALVLPAEKEAALLAWLNAPVKPPACSTLHLDDPTWPARGDVTNEKPEFQKCFRQLAHLAIPLYKKFEPLVAPDALTSSGPGIEPDYFFDQKSSLKSQIESYVQLEAAVSTKISAMSKVGVAAADPAPCPPLPQGATSCPALTYTQADSNAATELADYQKLIDAVSADLAGYDQRLKDLGSCGYKDQPNGPDPSSYCWQDGFQYHIGTRVSDKGTYYVLHHTVNSCIKSTPGKSCEPSDDPDDWTEVDDLTAQNKGPYTPPKPGADGYSAGDEVTFGGTTWTCIAACQEAPSTQSQSWLKFSQKTSTPRTVTIDSRQDASAIYGNMVTRTITYSLDSLNLVSYSQQSAPLAANKKALASIAINFADRPNKVAGLPSGSPYNALRWEASAGVFFSWLPSRTFTISSANTVVDSKTRPIPVPFAAANYRLTGDFGGRWKQNIYMTAAVGVNADNSTAEFGVGPSYSWRMFMVNFFCHFGHDYRYTSTTPSGSAGTLPTAAHWTEAPAIGISVRVPSLTGR
jgi:hypothetical protein